MLRNKPYFTRRDQMTLLPWIYTRSKHRGGVPSSDRFVNCRRILVPKDEEIDQEQMRLLAYP